MPPLAGRLTLLLAVHSSLRACCGRTHTDDVVRAVADEADYPSVRWIGNVTAPVGRDITLHCSVHNLGDYKVGWMKSDTRTILTVHNLTVTKNPRIGVSHHRQHTWSIHIRQLKKSDHGCYMCQVNTRPMRSQTGCVDVQVPPDIVSSESSGDLSLTEGDSARLTCIARGYPRPRITWRREDSQPIYTLGDYRNGQKVREVTGVTLNLTRISRRQMGAYLCIARNKVPPASSKRIFVYVNFEPEIKVQKQLLGIMLGGDVTLSCHVEAFPNTINYWLDDRNKILLGSRKYSLTEQKRGYRITMRLQIRRVGRADIGLYRCVSSNSMGTSEASIRLHHMKHVTAPNGRRTGAGRQTALLDTHATTPAPAGAPASPSQPVRLDWTPAALLLLAVHR